jgi:putative ABC transport system ATP-binding protein
MWVIEARRLKKTYLTGEVEVEAVRGIDLQVKHGEFIAVMGPSGSGKSTFLQLLGGMDVPTDGQLFIDGVDVSTLTDDQRTLLRRRRIGFVFQSFNLLPTLDAEQNVALPLELDGIGFQPACDRARESLAMVGLSHRLNHLPSRLSGGEQQRVAIARALVIRPAVLLADEPTGNLDSATVASVLKLLRQLADEKGQTIVLVTHDPEVAAHADRLIRVRDGLVESDEILPHDEVDSATAVEQGV